MQTPLSSPVNYPKVVPYIPNGAETGRSERGFSGNFQNPRKSGFAIRFTPVDQGFCITQPRQALATAAGRAGSQRIQFVNALPDFRMQLFSSHQQTETIVNCIGG